MNARISRWLLPAGAALAVLLIVAVVAWTQRGGDDPVAIEPGSDVPGQSEPGSEGPGGESPGAGEPGSPGDLEPLPDGAGPGDDLGYPAADGTIAATGYHVYGPRRLAIIYTNGVPECYGEAGTPVVEETGSEVTVTIPRVGPGKAAKDRACIEIAIVGHVDVTLDAPLAGRPVLDGARGGQPLERQSLPGEDGAL